MLKCYSHPKSGKQGLTSRPVLASVGAHFLVAFSVASLSARAVSLPPEAPPQITFVRSASAQTNTSAATNPGPVAAVRQERRHVTPRKPRKSEPRAPEPASALAETEPATASQASAGGALPSAGGGVTGGGGAPGVLHRDLTLAFGPGMERPRLLSRSSLVYTPSARAARVTGLAVVRCLITKTGRVTQCRVITGLPHGMSEQIVKMLESSVYTPVLYQGEAQAVHYTFPIRIRS